MISVIAASVGLIMLGYLAVGSAGYYAYPDAVGGNVLNVLPADDPWVQVGVWGSVNVWEAYVWGAACSSVLHHPHFPTLWVCRLPACSSASSLWATTHSTTTQHARGRSTWRRCSASHQRPSATRSVPCSRPSSLRHPSSCPCSARYVCMCLCLSAGGREGGGMWTYCMPHVHGHLHGIGVSVLHGMCVGRDDTMM